jgi:molybdopterin-guanine dinucleotide biosynthesis protein B
MPPVVAIVGPSQSGKTTFIEKLIPELISRGYKVATVKHTHHHVVPEDPEKDSWRHLEAGASAVVLGTPRMVVLNRPASAETGLAEIVRLLGEDYDLVIAEGFKQEKSVPKIEVHRKAAGPLLTALPNLLAVASDEKLTVQVPQFSLEDAGGVAGLIEESVIKPDMPRSVIYADGFRVPMKGFIQDMVANIAEGIAASLKGIGEGKRIDIFVRKR